MSLSIDWRKESDGNSDNTKQEMVPQNTYAVEVNKWEKVKAGTGTPQVRWFAKITDGPFKGVSLLDHTPLTEKALWKIATFVKVCGIPVQSLPKMDINGEKFTRILDLCKGRKMYWEVIISVYNGRKSNKVEGYIPEMTQDPVDLSNLEDIPSWVTEK